MFLILSMLNVSHFHSNGDVKNMKMVHVLCVQVELSSNIMIIIIIIIISYCSNIFKSA